MWGGRETGFGREGCWQKLERNRRIAQMKSLAVDKLTVRRATTGSIFSKGAKENKENLFVGKLR